jgi:hypothetical protein
MQKMKLRFTTSAEGVGEREKTIKYRFFEAKEPKQGVCQAECIEARQTTMRREWAFQIPPLHPKRKVA